MSGGTGFFEKNIYMTNSFTRDIMEDLFQGCDEVILPKNADLYRPEMVVRYVYWLYEGLVEVYAENENGEKQVVAYHYPDSFVGDIQSLGEEVTFLTCTAVKPSRLKRCDVDIFVNRLLERNLIRPYLKLLVGKTQTNVVQLLAISLDDCETRINKYYNNELTHNQLAELVGCSRVQVTRILNKDYRKNHQSNSSKSDNS